MSTAAIEIQGVRKAFRRRERESGAPWWRREWKDKVALHELDLVIETGGITGILGPNGSGKSTLIRILGTLLTPDAGRATVFGWDVVDEPLSVRRHVNRVSVEAAFFKELSPWENMLYAARLYGRVGRWWHARKGRRDTRSSWPSARHARPADEAALAGAAAEGRDRAQLLDRAVAAAHGRADHRSKKEVQALLQMLTAEREVTVLLCTHDMDEAAQLCDRVLMMDAGRVLADGTPDELCRRYSIDGTAATLEDVFMRLSGKSLELDGEEVER